MDLRAGEATEKSGTPRGTFLIFVPESVSNFQKRNLIGRACWNVNF
jgi:hypothetical protein